MFIEAMGKNGETAWHHINADQRLTEEERRDSGRVMAKAHLNTLVSLRPVFLGDGTEIPDKFAVVQDESERVFGITGKRFRPLQNEEAFNFMDSFAQDGQIAYESAFATGQGERVNLVARIQEEFKIGGKDAIRPYLWLSNAHDGCGSVTGNLVVTRVICGNTATAARREIRRNKGRGEGGELLSFNVRHTGKMEEGLKIAQRSLGLMHESTLSMVRRFEQMAQAGASEELIAKVQDILIPPPADDATDRIKNSYAADVEGFNIVLNTEPTTQFAGGRDNRWGVFNAATYWIDWAEPRKGQRLIVNTPGFRTAMEKRSTYSVEGKGMFIRQEVHDELMVGI